MPRRAWRACVRRARCSRPRPTPPWRGRTTEDSGYTGGTGSVRSLAKDGREFSANGSGGLFLAGFRLLPDQDIAIVVAMNGVAPEALEAVVGALKERYQLPK